MLRAIYTGCMTGLRSLEPLLHRPSSAFCTFSPRKFSLPQTASYSTIISPTIFTHNHPCKSLLFQSPQLLNCKYKFPIIQPSSRSVIKFSLRKGKRKSVKAVIKRFYRLDWGIWIRTKAGRKKHLWKKSESRKRRLRQHVFCNATQSTLLDKMVTRFWKKRRYYIDDPYEPYHKREEFPFTRKNPI